MSEKVRLPTAGGSEYMKVLEAGVVSLVSRGMSDDAAVVRAGLKTSVPSLFELRGDQGPHKSTHPHSPARPFPSPVV